MNHEKPIHAAHNRILSFIYKTWKVIVWTFGAIVTIGGLSAYLMFLPNVTIHQYVTLDPKDPFKTIFTIENNSFFSIHVKSLDTILVDVVDSRNNHIVNGGIFKPSSVNLSAGKSTSLTVDLEPAFTGLGLPVKNAQIEAVATYKYLFLEGTTTSNFLMVYDSAGDAHWIPVDQQ